MSFSLPVNLEAVSWGDLEVNEPNWLMLEVMYEDDPVALSVIANSRAIHGLVTAVVAAYRDMQARFLAESTQAIQERKMATQLVVDLTVKSDGLEKQLAAANEELMKLQRRERYDAKDRPRPNRPRPSWAGSPDTQNHARNGWTQWQQLSPINTKGNR